jgi:hypothetical protein
VRYAGNLRVEIVIVGGGGGGLATGYIERHTFLPGSTLGFAAISGRIAGEKAVQYLKNLVW